MLLKDLRKIEFNDEAFCDLFKDSKVTAFVRALVKESYEEVFSDHKREVGDMADKAWDLLIKSAPKGRHALEDAIAVITEDIFHKEDKAFWFNKEYLRYKSDIRAKNDLLRLEELIKGKKVLDFGSGGGHIAYLLSKKGYEVTTMDVLDYREPKAALLPFKAMSHPADITFDDNSFDTTIIKGVLHHIDAKYVQRVLHELHRVSKRIIIEDDMFGIPKYVPGLKEQIKKQKALKQFLSFIPSEQLECIMLIDFFSNTITQGIKGINLPLTFRTLKEWERLITKNGFTIADEQVVGFQERNVTRTCHVWLTADAV